MVLHARRDRRWCQGNLQHARVMTAPGLSGWNRFVFLQGILNYVARTLARLPARLDPCARAFTPLDYFPQANWPFPTPGQPGRQGGRARGARSRASRSAETDRRAVCRHHRPRAQLRRRASRHRIDIGRTRALQPDDPVFLMFQARSILQVLLGATVDGPPNHAATVVSHCPNPGKPPVGSR